jgi:hypothetical protein
VGRGQGWGVAQSSADDLNDTVDIAQDFVIPKSKDAITFRLEKFRSLIIQSEAAHLVMLPAINFDYEPSLVACKVHKIRADGRLTPKM